MKILSDRYAPIAPSLVFVLTRSSWMVFRLVQRPLRRILPGCYFHRTLTVLGEHLEHALVARVSLPGYATHEILLVPLR